jgi:hypothetical protein
VVGQAQGIERCGTVGCDAWAPWQSSSTTILRCTTDYLIFRTI